MRCQLTLISALFVALTSGCFVHSGYPYGYYGPGPGVVPQQPMNTYPAGPGYPTYTPGVPSYPTPLNGDPGTTPPSSPPINNTYGTGTNGSNDSAPPFDANNPGGGRSVPPPGDDDGSGSVRGGTTQRPALQPTQASSTDSEEITPFSQKESRRSRPTDDGESLVEADDQFQPPVVQQTSAVDEGDSDFGNSTSASPNSKQKLYAHDAQFTWVQGTVEYDKQTRTWGIMYDDAPTESDPLGGFLVLVEDPKLARLRTGDKVRLYGSLDDSIIDSRNQPVFRLSRIERR